MRTSKLQKLREEAEHKRSIKETGVKGNIRFVFVDPDDLIELLDMIDRLKKRPVNNH